ncbi:MFS transporter [Novosphingobium cyanobacteriorum]|uniref:MFS transporter n=1 Tax=Novosphingobium cyanobacteriorum TaxID=3024215 RepID=A0ABT6CQ70_9SPHN|nr:MFS transporter [Novosphingobium cyanobacteriorum]MDF8334487.1 MFS transporter [Novosphingobium cyanobacteriorum]
MNAVRQFYRDLTLKPQGFTMVVAAFLPVFAIIAMFPVVAAIIGHFKDDPDAAIKVPQMVTAPGYAIALLSPFAGLIADKFGRRRLLLACTFFYGIVGAAPFLMDDLDHIIASRILLGVCEAGILTIINTLIGDYWDDKGRRNWLMLQGIVGPFLQPAVFFLVAAVAAVRWNGGFLVYLVAFPIFIAMFFFMFEPQKPEAAKPEAGNASAGPAASSAFPLKEALMVASLTLFASILYYVFIVNGSIAWAEIGVNDPMAVTKATAIPALFVCFGAFVFRLMSRFGNAAQLAAMLGFLGIGLAGIGLAHSVFAMQVGLAFQQTGAGMAVPALIAWAQTKFGFAHRGRGMGIWSSAFFLGQAISPQIVGRIATGAGSMQGAFLVTGMIALAAAVAGLLIASRTQPQPAAA